MLSIGRHDFSDQLFEETATRARKSLAQVGKTEYTCRERYRVEGRAHVLRMEHHKYCEEQRNIVENSMAGKNWEK
jgi:hypothetical protein